MIIIIYELCVFWNRLLSLSPARRMPSMENDNFPLSQADSDSMVTVSSVTGDSALQSRLLSLGFTPGAKVCLCSPPSPCGCRRVIVRNSPLVLDGAAAKAILCCHCSDSPRLARRGKKCGCNKKRWFGGAGLHPAK